MAQYALTIRKAVITTQIVGLDSIAAISKEKIK